MAYERDTIFAASTSRQDSRPRWVYASTRGQKRFLQKKSSIVRSCHLPLFFLSACYRLAWLELSSIEEFLAFYNAGSKSIKSARAIEMVESQVARVGPYHRDAYSGIGHFEPALHNVRSISTLVNHLVTPSQDEYLVRNQPDLVRNFMSAISFVPILHKSVSKLALIS
jgi:hypothetical protein